MPFMSLITYLCMDKKEKSIKMFKGYFNTLNLCTENSIMLFQSEVFKFDKISTWFLTQMLDFISGSSLILLNYKFLILKTSKIKVNILNKSIFEINEVKYKQSFSNFMIFYPFFFCVKISFINKMKILTKNKKIEK